MRPSAAEMPVAISASAFWSLSDYQAVMPVAELGKLEAEFVAEHRHVFSAAARVPRKRVLRWMAVQVTTSRPRHTRRRHTPEPASDSVPWLPAPKRPVSGRLAAHLVARSKGLEPLTF